MICKNCGSVMNDNADICYVCGTPARTEQPPSAAVYTLEDPPASPESFGSVAPRPAVVVDNAQKADIFARFFSFFFALIGLILYGVQRKNGEEAKAVSIADSIMIGICAKMAVAIGFVLYTYITHR